MKTLKVLHCILICMITIISSVGQSFGKTRFVRAMFNSDASREITIGWDQLSGEFDSFHYDTVSTTFSNTAALSRKQSAKSMNNHFVRLKGLRPNTTYYFYIQDSEGKSQVYSFATVPDNPTARLSFIAGGDSRDLSEVRRKANILVGKLNPHAVLFNGDFTGLDLSKQWVEWFSDWEHSISQNGKITPLVVSRGNHELSNRSIRDLFDVPNRKILYTTTFGGSLISIISLNSEIRKSGRQKLFLKQSLRKHSHYTWQLPQYHRPVRPHVAHKKEMDSQYKHFVPLFEQYNNVRLCLENDSHTCKITWPIIRSTDSQSELGFIRNDESGIVYAGEGCWGAPLREADDLKSWTRDAEAINQFNWIFVDQTAIEIRTVKYETSQAIQPLNNQTRFDIPAGIDLWSPQNGAVVTISK